MSQRKVWGDEGTSGVNVYERDYGKRARRTMDVMKEVKAYLPPEEASAWIRDHMALAKKSTTAYEEAWRETKRLLVKETAQQIASLMEKFGIEVEP